MLKNLSTSLVFNARNYFYEERQRIYSEEYDDKDRPIFLRDEEFIAWIWIHKDTNCYKYQRYNDS